MNGSASNQQSRASFVAEAFQQACLAELTALKPGNVHIFADGHGMVVQDFIKSAEVVATVIAQPEMTVGQRILASVEATWQAVGCNTNLGIILLAAPLIHAALRSDSPLSLPGLQTKLRQVLNELTVQDAELAYQAIRIASPAGLGQSEEHDVYSVPTITLLTAMKISQDLDMVAKQYANGYEEIFGFGLNRYHQMVSRWQSESWAVTSVYLGFLAAFNDSHIMRKLGEDQASSSRQEAIIHDQAIFSLSNPKLYQRALMQFDSDLKDQNINPGTSADLTVTTALAARLSEFCK